MRRFLAASVACGVVISGATIVSAVVLAHIVAGVITDPATRTVAHWAGQLWILVALWMIRTVAHWLQGRLSQRGATAVIGDLAGEVLRTVTALPPRQLAGQRDSAAALITRGLDGLRPYFTAYLPSLVLAGILTPAAVVVIAAYDVSSAVIVLIALPLIPIFMVLIGMLTARPVRGGAGRDDHAAVAAAGSGCGHSHAARARPGGRIRTADRRTRCGPSPFGDGDAAYRVSVGAGARAVGHPRCRARRGQCRPAPGIRRHDAGGRALPPCCWRRRSSGRCAASAWSSTPPRMERPPPTRHSGYSTRCTRDLRARAPWRRRVRRSISVRWTPPSNLAWLQC